MMIQKFLTEIHLSIASNTMFVDIEVDLIKSLFNHFNDFFLVLIYYIMNYVNIFRFY